MCNNWAEVFTVADAESHDKTVCSESHLLTYTEFMAGGWENLPIIRVCRRAAPFDLDGMRMFGSTAQTEKRCSDSVASREAAI